MNKLTNWFFKGKIKYKRPTRNFKRTKTNTKNNKCIRESQGNRRY